MLKIKNNSILNKLIAITILIILLFNFAIPYVVFAARIQCDVEPGANEQAIEKLKNAFEAGGKTISKEDCKKILEDMYAKDSDFEMYYYDDSSKIQIHVREEDTVWEVMENYFTNKSEFYDFCNESNGYLDIVEKTYVSGPGYDEEESGDTDGEQTTQGQGSTSDTSPTTGLDTITGLLLEPAMKFFKFILDIIMQLLTKVMTQGDFESVMVPYDELPEITEPAAATFTIEDMTPYENVFGNLNLKYPNFKYSPEEIFAGNIDLLEINFINESNDDGDWNKIRDVISVWYKFLRRVTIIGLLSVLIYTGIKIMTSSTSKNKAKYKEMIINWFIAVVLIFSLQYIMSFILNFISEITGLLKGVSGIIEVQCVGDKTFKTNLIGLARFQLQQQHFSAKVGYLVIYTALVVYTFKFTMIYLKRVLKMAFLTVISPIVVLTYPIDKMDGKAKGFEMWLKEYIYNALLQPMHYILYYILVSTSLTLAARNPIYGIAALMFISNAERLLKRIFGFDKATGGTVGGLAGAYATGVIASKVTNFIRNPLHPFGGGKGGSGSGSRQRTISSGGGQSQSDGEDEIDEFFSNIPSDAEEIDYEDFAGIDMRTILSGRSENSEERDTEPIEPIQPVTPPDINSENIDYSMPGMNNFISRYRGNIDQNSYDEMGGLSFADGSTETIDDIFRKYNDNLYKLEKYNRMNTLTPSQQKNKENIEKELHRLESLLRYRIDSNEMNFKNNSIPLQYIDENSNMETTDLMKRLFELLKMANDHSYTLEERQKYRREANNVMKQLKDRMLQNQYIYRQGGPQSLLKQEYERLNNGNGINPIVFAGGVFNPLMPENSESTEGNGENNQPQPETRENTTSRGRQPEGTTSEGTGRTARRGVDTQTRRTSQRTIRNPAEDSRRRRIVNPIEETIEQDEQEQEYVPDRSLATVGRGLVNVGKRIIKPAYDTEREGEGWRFAGKVLKGAIGVTAGIAAASVQAGISITDGRYNALEGVGTVGATVAGVSMIGRNRNRNGIIQTYKDGANAGDEGKSIEEYRKQWFNRDDVINGYNKEFPGEGSAMRRRAANNYVTRGITDIKEQAKAIRFAELIRRERGFDEEEADKIAVATLQYRKSLTGSGNYDVLINSEKRKKYLDIKVEAYMGSASSDSVRQLHDDFIQNVRDFDRANR